jgi:hypothetical protein
MRICTEGDQIKGRGGVEKGKFRSSPELGDSCFTKEGIITVKQLLWAGTAALALLNRRDQ